MNNPKILERNSDEYRNLSRASDMLNQLIGASPIPEKTITFEPKDIYFDFGLNWMWTSIVATQQPDDSWQCLSPKRWGEIITAKSHDELLTAVRETINDNKNIITRLKS